MSYNREYNTEYMRNRRIKAKIEGICTICLKNKPKKGYFTCDQCITYSNKRKEKENGNNK